jgi:threonine/homoserine/homoserine lactone efflux protein
MASGSELLLYFSLVFGIIVLPGMDMAFVMGNALVAGRRAGLRAVAGIIAGGLWHMAFGAAGVTLLLAGAPGLFRAMLLVGAAYVAWMGWTLLRSAGGLQLPQASGAAQGGAAFRGAVLTSLLNPKAYLFTLAVLPQFVRPERGAVWAQVAVLFVITAATQAGVYGTLALLAARSREWLGAHGRAAAHVARAVGALLLGVAVLTVLQGWRAV